VFVGGGEGGVDRGELLARGAPGKRESKRERKREGKKRRERKREGKKRRERKRERERGGREKVSGKKKREIGV